MCFATPASFCLQFRVQRSDDGFPLPLLHAHPSFDALIRTLMPKSKL